MAVAPKQFVYSEVARKLRTPTYRDGLTIAFVSTYPPQECGIATYTQDLIHALEMHGCIKRATVVAVSDGAQAYDHHVNFVIRKNSRKDYALAAEFLNDSDVDIVNIQHEFGIFGGEDGEFVLELYKGLKKPIVTTLHTILYNVDSSKRRITQLMAQHSKKLIVMNSIAFWLLSWHYGIDAANVALIYHGAPDIPFGLKEEAKGELNLSGKIVLSTFGLINRGKGIEYAIQAMSQIVKHYPQAIYLIIGRTHPNVVRYEGESYRMELEELVRKLGLSEHVRFVNKYLTKGEIIRYLCASDIYICPYTSLNQIVSGTLAYAVAAGKAIISTPSLYAQEVLAEGRGLLCEPCNPESISEKVIYLLSNPRELEALERRAYRFGRQMTWQAVAWDHERLFREVVAYSYTHQAYPSLSDSLHIRAAKL